MSGRAINSRNARAHKDRLKALEAQERLQKKRNHNSQQEISEPQLPPITGEIQVDDKGRVIIPGQESVRGSNKERR